MRNISFSATKAQFRSHRKHVTRRLKWLNLKPGDHLMGCEKVQGIKKGQLIRMGEITVLQVNREPLIDILIRPAREGIHYNILRNYGTNGMPIYEVELEGFPEFINDQGKFVDLFCEMNDCTPGTEITRILFDYGGFWKP